MKKPLNMLSAVALAAAIFSVGHLAYATDEVDPVDELLSQTPQAAPAEDAYDSDLGEPPVAAVDSSGRPVEGNGMSRQLGRSLRDLQRVDSHIKFVVAGHRLQIIGTMPGNCLPAKVEYLGFNGGKHEVRFHLKGGCLKNPGAPVAMSRLGGLGGVDENGFIDLSDNSGPVVLSYESSGHSLSDPERLAADALPCIKDNKPVSCSVQSAIDAQKEADRKAAELRAKRESEFRQVCSSSTSSDAQLEAAISALGISDIQAAINDIKKGRDEAQLAAIESAMKKAKSADEAKELLDQYRALAEDLGKPIQNLDQAYIDARLRIGAAKIDALAAMLEAEGESDEEVDQPEEGSTRGALRSQRAAAKKALAARKAKLAAAQNEIDSINADLRNDPELNRLSANKVAKAIYSADEGETTIVSLYEKLAAVQASNGLTAQADRNLKAAVQLAPDAEARDLINETRSAIWLEAAESCAEQGDVNCVNQASARGANVDKKRLNAAYKEARRHRNDEDAVANYQDLYQSYSSMYNPYQGMYAQLGYQANYIGQQAAAAQAANFYQTGYGMAGQTTYGQQAQPYGVMNAGYQQPQYGVMTGQPTGGFRPY